MDIYTQMKAKFEFRENHIRTNDWSRQLSIKEDTLLLP